MIFALRQETHGYTCIFIRFEFKIYIHEVKHKIGITCKKENHQNQTIHMHIMDTNEHEVQSYMSQL